MEEVSSVPASFPLLKIPTVRHHHPAHQGFPHRRRGLLQAVSRVLTRLLLDRMWVT